MKKELKRYSLVEYLGKVQRVVTNEDDYLNILKSIDSSNRKTSFGKFFGNVTKKYLGGEIFITIHVYNRLTPKMTISDIDKLTSSLNERELIELFKDKLKTKEEYVPDINIAYFEDKNKKLKTENDVDRRILYLPIVYINDIKYLDIKYIKRCLVYHSDNKDIDFFKALAYRFELYISCMEEIESLYEAIEKVEHKNANSDLLYFASLKLLNKLIYERDKNDSLIRLDDGAYQLSKRRLRDFGMFMKYYNCSIKNSPLEYNGHLIKNKIEMQEYEHRFENMEDSFNEYNAYNSWDDGRTFKLKK